MYVIEVTGTSVVFRQGAEWCYLRMDQICRLKKKVSAKAVCEADLLSYNVCVVRVDSRMETFGRTGDIHPLGYLSQRLNQYIVPGLYHCTLSESISTQMVSRNQRRLNLSD